jgi:pimeloyl-ACP methyl ester carboxylesterase
MKKIPIRENGLVGTLFRKGNPSSAIIVLGGSSGGLSEIRAEQLAEQGFATLALAYFAAESLPPTLKQIPLEYFERAIHRLRSEEGIERVGIWGGSRGGELSLILGTVFPDQIDAIAAHVPSSVVYGALDDHSAAAWTYQGRPIAPNAPFQYVQETTGECESSAIAATPCFLNAMKDKTAFAASAILVEKLRCPLLLISAEDDKMWPSYLFAQQIIERLAQHKSPIFYSHISYAGVGHAPSKGTAGLHPIMKRWFAYGGNPADNAHAAEDWLRQTVHFFKERL